MASKTLTFEIIGKDKSATKAIDGVGAAAARVGPGLEKMGGLLAAGLAISGAAAVGFAVDSVKAYADSQKAQSKLEDAFSRFPKLADTNITKLGRLNTALAKKTRFDDDATSSGQAVLAQFDLTGKQIEKLTPLMQDYAAKTGSDLPTAAEDLGKAMLGQGKALKQIGVDFTDTGTLAGNFDEIVGGLSDKVGGFAEKEGTTAAGKLETLRNRFGEVQEKIGGALMPTLDALVGFLNDDFMSAVEDGSTWIAEKGIPGIQGIVDWVVRWKDILGPAAIAVGVLTGAQWALNVAMDANPIGLVIVGIAALIGWVVVLSTNLGGVTDKAAGVGATLLTTGSKIALALLTITEAFTNSVIGMINALLGPLNTARGVLNLPAVSIGKVDFTSGLTAFAVNAENVAAMPNKFDYAQKAPSGPIRLTPVVPRNGSHGGKALAAGGVVPSTPGGGWFNVGEGKHDEAVIPLTPSVLSEIGAGIRAASGSSPTSNAGGIFTGNLILDSGEFMGKIRGEIRAADTSSALTTRMGLQR